MHVHLAYSKLGIDYGRDNDPYSIEGIDTKYREVIKLATLTSLNMKNAKYFSQTMTKRLQEDGLYIPNVPYNDIKKAILKKHHPSCNIFDCIKK